MFRNRGLFFRKTILNMVWCSIFYILKLQLKPFIVISACITYYTLPVHMYNRLPENEPSDSKPVEDIKISNIHLGKVHFLGYIVQLQHNVPLLNAFHPVVLDKIYLCNTVKHK